MGDDADLEALLREVARAPEVVVPGTRVGRFELGARLGAGGMGVVHEAIDPTLDRRVAIKLLRAGSAEGDGAARLLREAQALARLAHPNVVTVFDAGRDGDQVYIAMELVGGTTARAWRTASPRRVHEILEVYRQAAAGLAAAHRCGLVHRDIKPENILVGDDGRVRVTDFGLAAGLGDAEPAATTDEPDAPLTRTLTQTGAVLGTPPYMPPEAFLRDELDARSDQWSLCVTLWEALGGERPFTGQTMTELAAAVCAGKIGRVDAVPARLRPALLRGLSIDPADRWPSIDALIAGLARPRRIPRAALALGAAAAVGVTAVLAWPRGDDPPARPTAAVAPTPTPVKRTYGGCPYMPVYVDDATIVFDDGNGDLHVLRGDAPAAALLAVPGRSDWRANRGRRPGEAVFVASGALNQAGFIDVATGAVEILPIQSGSYAVGGGAVFYTRGDVPEIRRVIAGEDAPVFQLPDGRWPYTVAVTADGAKVAVTTATDRSSPTICLGDVAARTIECLDRDDGIRGRAAFSPDGATLYYQTRAGIRRRVLATEDDVLWLPGFEALGGIDVAPSGRSLVFSDDRPRGIEAAPLDALDQPIIAGASGSPAFAGGRWFYSRDRDGQLELVAQAADGSVVVLARLPASTSGIAVDPTGRNVAYDADGDAPGLYVVDTKGQPPVRITMSAADSNPVWTADGKLAFTRWKDMQASVMIADPTVGSKDDAARVAAHAAPRITLARVPATGELVLAGPDPWIYLWHPTTGVERRIDGSGLGERPVLQVAAAPDGSALVVLTQVGDKYELWTLPLDGGAPSLTFAQPDCSALDRPAFDDAGRLYAVTAPWRGDIYTVDLE